MHSHSSAIGALSRPQFVRLLQILEPYRELPITAPVMALAARLARQEVDHAA